MPGVAQGGSTGTMCKCVPSQDSCPMQQRRLSQLAGTGNPGTSARGFRNGSVNEFSGSLVRSSRRISQMHKEVVSCFRRWHSGDVQIDGLLPTCD